MCDTCPPGLPCHSQCLEPPCIGHPDVQTPFSKQTFSWISGSPRPFPLAGVPVTYVLCPGPVPVTYVLCPGPVSTPSRTRGALPLGPSVRRSKDEDFPVGLTLLFLFNFLECGYSNCAPDFKKSKTNDCFLDVKQNEILAVN